MYRQPRDAACTKAALDFSRWALDNGQKMADELDYVPLPPALVTQVNAYWRSEYGDGN